MKTTYTSTLFVTLVLLSLCGIGQTTSVLKLGSQSDYVKTRKFVFDAAAKHYHGTSSSMNKNLNAPYGEFSVYVNAKGDVVYPDALPQTYSTLVTSTSANYDLTTAEHWAVNYDRGPKKIALFRSKSGGGNSSVSWQALYFQKLFDELLPAGGYCIVDEDNFKSGNISDSTELVVFPAVKVNGQDYNYYVDSICGSIPLFAPKMQAFLKRGGKVYTEGNGVLFLVKAGILAAGSVSYATPYAPDGNNFYDVEKESAEHLVGNAADVAGAKLYGTAIPAVTASDATKLLTLKSSQSPAVFSVKNAMTSYANQVVANLGLTAVHRSGADKKQSLYTLECLLSFFTSKLDVTRNVRNTLVGTIVAGDNAVAYDVVDTFTVNVVLKNLSASPISNVQVTEKICPYFTFNKVISGASATVSGNDVTFTGISINAHGEKVISYSLISPAPDSKEHENVDKYIAEQNFISVAKNTTTYSTSQGQYVNTKSMAYADLLFSAMITADADVNWKNFLGLEYQPFKVFMNMENKARTQAENLVYTQYIPKDVPYYWTDKSINIPILRTPGGEFVAVMRGSNDAQHPDYDFDSDGKPDAWLDTASIYPKGYTLTEEEVYWANPWSHLKSGYKGKTVYEDIDKDGAVAQDNDGDGKVDVDEPGDKIRVWKVTWNIGTMAGYEYYEPYCYYELWLDPPKLVELSAGVAFASDSLKESFNGMYYPFAPTMASADLSDKKWTNWMEKDANGQVIWKEMVLQSANNYEGYTFVDTAKQNFRLRPTDKVIGRAPQPHNEFIAVVSLGGEEIDMTHWTPTKSLYSNVDYKTIFNETKRTPIRSTYTYYAPLPNPLQFSYLGDRCTITDSTGSTVSQLPEHGKATLTFDIDASTEYSYYWIRGMGHDVDFNDPSEAAEGPRFADLGDGVFGYFVYEIPKGMGGYRITLPRNDDGTFKVGEIVQVNGASFTPWINNPNTLNQVEVWENALSYQVYIPQVLIPPALDDDNHDGIDDWKDDLGDRFSSKTGFLHDAFMDKDGEAYPKSSTTSHFDNLAGQVDSGWYEGADKTFGDDEFEAPGKTHFTIKANYEGKGREGLIEICKGGTLVVEEIFGGSPWVIFSHAMSGKSQGLDLSVKSSIQPSVVKIGIDTVYIKHTIEDKNEPHSFNIQFDPYHHSLGFDDANITTLVGAKDPCNLIEPAIAMPAIIDPSKASQRIKLVPMAASINSPSLAGYPKTVTGTFVEVRVEVSNCSDLNWKDVTVTPSLPAGTSLAMQYVANPRPLVTDDNFGTFETGWRFNQPEGEVLIEMGNTISLMQPTRRAYFVFLLSVDKSMAKGIYDVSFTISGQKVSYTGALSGSLAYSVPPAQFCVADKNANGSVIDFEKMVLGQALLKTLKTDNLPDFKSLGEAKWSVADINAVDYPAVKDKLTTTASGGSQTLDLNQLGAFPSKQTAKLFILQPGVVDSYNSDEDVMKLTNGQELKITVGKKDSIIKTPALSVTPIGPRVRITHELYSINGKPASHGIQYESDKTILVATLLKVKNYGADISKNTSIIIQTGNYFEVINDSLPKKATFADKKITLHLGDMIQGEEKTQFLYFTLMASIPKGVDITTLVDKVDIEYSGTAIDAGFKFANDSAIGTHLYDFEIAEMTFSQVDDNTIHVSAKAFNRGVDAQNVWFRVYPVIGQGAHEFALVEQDIASFKAGETITIEKDYTLPNIGKSLEMFTRVDDEEAFVETTEKNNSEKTGFILTTIPTLSKEDEIFTAGPNPFDQQLAFDYVLTNNIDNISIKIFNNSGTLVKSFDNCPTNKGSNKVLWNNIKAPAGTYFYEISSGTNVVGKGKLVKK